jgi:hypothetical protein
MAETKNALLMLPVNIPVVRAFEPDITAARPGGGVELRKISIPAGSTNARPTWKPAIQQVWKPALLVPDRFRFKSVVC